MTLSLVKQGIRVNALAPGPAWAPLSVSTFPTEQVEILGTDISMGRAVQLFEITPAYVYLASNDSAYVTGQVLHINGALASLSQAYGRGRLNAGTDQMLALSRIGT